MKFCEAVQSLKAGKKITRNSWKGSIQFLMDNGDIKSYQPRLTNFLYNEMIMVSTGWLVEGEEQPHDFCDIVSLLIQGKKAKLPEWDEEYIYLDKETRHIVFYSMEMFPFIPDFDSFTAQDWIEI
jgi:hypothetical protein